MRDALPVAFLLIVSWIMSRRVFSEQAELARIPVLHASAAVMSAFFINYIEAVAGRTGISALSAAKA